MTTNIEKQFFEIFGIEPKYDRMLCDNDYQCNGECNKCEHQEDDNKHKFYPQISDRILLELICILRDSYLVTGENIDVLKERALRACIRFQDDLATTNQTVKQQVQALFKEGQDGFKQM